MIYVFGTLVFLFVVLFILEMLLDIDNDFDPRKNYEKYKKKNNNF